ncbi:hypothetical protein [Microcoleus sp. bin38.metabat.b11b12b14.051]|uniref:hypothetical protein n=1 Tax=Microcoleus sp. bin38.metabat.b11b12b14.051 TaxID=2742709 RepID=UPI0025FE04C7|nr:hypothetical protein [Microcoleus sp. bin38.metabat.b11b12b14.051]
MSIVICQSQLYCSARVSIAIGNYDEDSRSARAKNIIPMQAETIRSQFDKNFSFSQQM